MIAQVEIKVSICSLVYNHEPYLRQCLDGFVMQQTTFPFEVIIHDDASTDGSADIIREYAARYPDIFVPIYQTENQYSKGQKVTSTFVFPRVRGKYIALCEGDDYWTDPLKLQKQVDFLEANPEYGLVYGKARQYDQTQGKFRPGTIGAPLTDFTDLVVKGNLIPTATALFRNELCKKYYEEDFPRDSWKMGDAPLWLYIAHCAKLGFLSDSLAVYRLLPNSAVARNSYNLRLDFIRSANQMRAFFVQKYAPHLMAANESRNHTVLFANAFHYGKRAEAVSYYKGIDTPSWSYRLRYWIVSSSFLSFCYYKLFKPGSRV